MRDAPPSEKLDLSTMASLASLLGSVATCDDARQLLAATMPFLERWHPQRARLIAVHSDAHGTTKPGAVLAEWQDGSPQPTASSRDLRSILGSLLATAQKSRLTGPMYLPDLDSEPQQSEELGAQLRADGEHAAVFVPLRVGRDGSLQGILQLSWLEPHPFSLEERELFKLLAAALSTHAGGLSPRGMPGVALRDHELVHSISRQLNLASTFDEALRLLVRPAPAADEAEVWLCSIEYDTQLQPAWLKVISHLLPPGSPFPSQVGARYYIPDIPFAKLYLSSPDAPILIHDVLHDDRVDANARALYTQTGARSTLIVGLTMGERWVGLLNLTWRRPIELGEREKFIYQALAKHASLRLEHTTTVERLRASLEETRRQESVLRTVLDNIPVGIVLTEAHSGRPVLRNAAAARFLGRPLDAEAPGEGSAQPSGFVRPDSEEPYPSEELPGMKALHTGATQTAELDVLLPGQERRCLEGIGVPMHDAAGAVQNVLVVLTDLTSRKRAEGERQRLQEEVLRSQAAALAERSSPLIPITDDILVLPIIGTIDTERGHQVIDTLLGGASQSRARVAIVDITGVRTVDTQAAATLTNAAQALRLLGVLPILTGIKAEVAQTLVALGISLDGIITRSTLQSGIQHALSLLGRSRLN